MILSIEDSLFLFKRVLARVKKDRDVYYSFIQVAREIHPVESFSHPSVARDVCDRMREIFATFAKKLGKWDTHEDEVAILELLVSDLESRLPIHQ